MHEEEVRAVGQHMAVEGRDGDAVVAQGTDHGVYLIPDQDEVPGGRRLAITRRLEVDRRRQPHGRRDVDSVRGDLLRPRHAHLVHAPVHSPVKPEDLADLRRVDAEGSGGRRGRGAPPGVVVRASAACTAAASFAGVPRPAMCMYITRGDSCRRWLCSAVCSIPPSLSLPRTGPTSPSSSTRSPITMASLSVTCLNATHEPSASAGFTATPPMATWRSLRGI